LLNFLKENQNRFDEANQHALNFLVEQGHSVDFDAFKKYSYDKRRGGWRLLNFVIDSGLNILEPLDIKIKGKLDYFRVNDLDPLLNIKAKAIQDQLDGTWNTKFDVQQRDYFSSIKESFGNMSNALIKNIAVNPKVAVAGAGYADVNLQRAVEEVVSVRGIVDGYKAKADKATDAAIKANYLDLATKMEIVLADTLTETTKIVANSGAELSVGTDGFKAMTEISANLGAIKDAAVLTKTLDNLNVLSGKGSGSFGTFVKNITMR
jgi:hypothetical protein